MVLVVSTGSLPIPLILPERMVKGLTVEKKLGVSHAFQLYLMTFFLYKSIISGTFFLPLSIRPYFLGVFGVWVWSTLTRWIHPTRLQKWIWSSLVQFTRWLHFVYTASLGLVPKGEIQPVERAYIEAGWSLLTPWTIWSTQKRGKGCLRFRTKCPGDKPCETWFYYFRRFFSQKR